MLLCFPTSPVYCFCITLRNRKPRRHRTGAMCVRRSPTAAALSTSFLLNHAANSPYSWTHWLQDLGSHTAVWVWVVNQKDWRNQAAGNTLIQHSREKCNFCIFPVLSGTAEAQVIWCGIIVKCLWLLALSIHFCQKVSQSVKICQSYSTPKVGRFFWDTV